MPKFNPWILFRAWCFVAPLAAVKAAPKPGPSPAPGPLLGPQPLPELQSNAVKRGPVPNGMGWIGSMGGLLGVISFTQDTIETLVHAFTPERPQYDSWEDHFRHFFMDWEKKYSGKPSGAPKKEGNPPWEVGVQVGLDGTGLKGAGGEFPQICLWNIHGQLIGYNDQTIKVASMKWHATAKWFNDELSRDGMPTIPNGGLQAMGIWPAPGHEDLSHNQAAYITMIKRHFDAICVAGVFVKWPDEIKWVFDGSWGRASNMSWYFSYIYASDARQRECFWLDHRGDLKHKQDLKEEYIGASVGALGKKPNKSYPQYLWAGTVVPENGIPEGDRLTEGMQENGVQDYKAPMGVKWHTPAFVPQNYGPNYDNLTVEDFVTNPGKINWIMNPMHENMRGGNPVLPLLHPQANLSDKKPELVWEDEFKQDIPVDCMTDWYYDSDDKLIEPGSGSRCRFFHEWKGHEIEGCRDNWKPINSRATNGPDGDYPTPSLQERHARTLVNDQNSRGGSGTKELCEDPHSVGPSYENHHERMFCRMTDKTLWPFCDGAEGVSHDCFDTEAEVLVEKTRPLGKRTLYWDAIEDWHSGERFKRAA